MGETPWEYQARKPLIVFREQPGLPSLALKGHHILGDKNRQGYGLTPLPKLAWPTSQKLNPGRQQGQNPVQERNSKVRT